MMKFIRIRTGEERRIAIAEARKGHREIAQLVGHDAQP
jgi:hypothetical protein